jgi:uncharacterized protein (DUF2235 family)
MAKNIVFFSDGTGNDSTRDDADTNVALLYERSLHDKAADPLRQVTLYDPGVGTEFGDLVGKATGTGISQNIRDGYDFVTRYYEPGDHIFVFGFSRGAYTVRSLAGMIGLVGVPRGKQTLDGRTADLHDDKDEAARRKLVDEAYAIYKIADAEERKDKASKFREKYGPPEHAQEENRAVHFIGVWDTVRSLGIPLGFMDLELTLWPHRFHNHDLGEHVRYAYHALSIDDQRQQFHPTLWNEPTKAQEAAKKSNQPVKQAFEQVWFPGVHSDVGGGYRERGLADVTLAWMLKRALAADPPLRLKPPFDADPFQGLNPDPGGDLHDSRDKLWKKVFYRIEPRTVCAGTQKPDSKLIDKTGEAAVNEAWLKRFVPVFRNYDPRSMREHPDYKTCVEQLDRQQPANGPFKHIVP